MKVTTVLLAAVVVLSGVDALGKSGKGRKDGYYRGGIDMGQKKDREARKTECPKSIGSRGRCNGYSCRVRGANYPCVFGKCVGDGGRDGACCGMLPFGVHARCPNGLTGEKELINGTMVPEDRGGWGWWGHPELPIEDWYTKWECTAIGPDLSKMKGMMGGSAAAMTLAEHFEELLEHDYSAEAMAAAAKDPEAAAAATAAVQDAEDVEEEEEEGNAAIQNAEAEAGGPPKDKKAPKGKKPDSQDGPPLSEDDRKRARCGKHLQTIPNLRPKLQF
ncbi:hypothetical protein CGMCC3_g4743 [Colletotrichum fructicola]|uniref:Uncharacterized protein n=1 Tax=Colletotrichum fructicola (strain Nara gc5) TaxID=1213859 RepID=A0A7J6JJQ4_COLFN|nr:uncharacterized protein CGMCC3_g4743 [Colletotrichum fructicola]KAE9579435.1 hypothetical protein CGMCC3_g4743 [Colletotrichum fructicola]KAF4429728.1 hypothetical protein CFRS1_v011810 [Colletotrichum fructicola]KAF4489903.1 hypothetical protein CGGC5_v002900 [Colletotrichum fructicola Nara gc5]KAF4902452.1 hypothetical protein CGCFRS4_v002129 [Colletotrichum fructicola]